MKILDAAATEAALPWAKLVDVLDEGFRQECVSPVRHHHDFDIPDEGAGTLLLMPAWTVGRFLGVKTVAVVPGNGARGLSAVQASYQLLDAGTGQFLAMIDGATLTNKRTAAASALAARYLARKDATQLLVVGTGGVARSLALAHAAVRDLKSIVVWGRTAANARSLAEELSDAGLPASVAGDLEAAARQADIISTATVSTEPIIFGDWLKPGAHLDLVGAFKPTMRESDDAALKRATVFVDTRAGALKEAGDIVLAIRSGAISESDVAADLFDLCGGVHAGRRDDAEITAFKSVGTALEDLVAATYAYERTAG
jgi:ornithine cyclodeaminase